MHGELLGHLHGLQLKRILVNTYAFQTKNFPQLTQPAIGREGRLLGCQDDFVKDYILKYKGHQGQDYNSCNGTQEVPPHHLKVLKERHFPFRILAHTQSEIKDVQSNKKNLSPLKQKSNYTIFNFLSEAKGKWRILERSFTRT